MKDKTTLNRTESIALELFVENSMSSVYQAASKLGVSNVSIYKWRKGGGINSQQLKMLREKLAPYIADAEHLARIERERDGLEPQPEGWPGKPGSPEGYAASRASACAFRRAFPNEAFKVRPFLPSGESTWHACFMNSHDISKIVSLETNDKIKALDICRELEKLITLDPDPCDASLIPVNEMVFRLWFDTEKPAFLTEEDAKLLDDGFTTFQAAKALQKIREFEYELAACKKENARLAAIAAEYEAFKSSLAALAAKHPPSSGYESNLIERKQLFEEAKAARIKVKKDCDPT